MSLSSVDHSQDNVLGLEFTVEDDGTALCAHYTPGESPSQLDFFRIKNLIAEHGFGEAKTAEPQVKALAQAVRSNKPWEGRIAEKFDAVISVEISKDEMKAYLTLATALGGTPLRKDAIDDHIKAAGLTHGLRKNAVAQLVDQVHQKPAGTPVTDVIATGTQPTRGQDTRFEPLVEEKAFSLEENDDGSVDYRNFTTINEVESGTPLLRKHPATAGTAGQTVTGKIIPAESGKYLDFNPGDGTEISEADPDVLVATRTGLPFLDENGARVDKILQVENVSLSTGHINFDGTLIVKGDIFAGMKVHVTGDIRVKGTVESADLNADGSIYLSGGMIGGHRAGEKDKKTKARVCCAGDFQARFVEHVQVHCEGNVATRESIAHSDVQAKGDVTVGKSGGRGQIVGGHISAGNLIDAKIFGSQAYIVTTLVVGYDEELIKQMEEINCQLTEKNKIMADLEVTGRHYQGSENEGDKKLLQRITNTRKKVESQTNELKQKKQELLELINGNNQATIICRKKSYPQVQLQINHATQRLQNEGGAGVYSVNQDAIHYTPGVR